MYLLSKLRSFHIYQTEGDVVTHQTNVFRQLNCLSQRQITTQTQTLHSSEGGGDQVGAAEVGQGWGKHRAEAGQG